METARGRWFLAEYAKRNRVSETDRVLDAISGLKTYITREHEPADVLQMRLDIVDMTQKIEQIKTEIANTDQSSPTISDAQIELNVVVDETETATSTILLSAEQIQGLGWEIRERGGADAECDKIDEFVTEIYMACSFQDLTGQRLRKVVQLTEMLETRLNAMVSLWDEDELARYRNAPAKRDELTNGPAIPHLAQDQDKIDAVMSNLESVIASDLHFNDLHWSDEEEIFDPDQPFMVDDHPDEAGAADIAAFEADTSEESFDRLPGTSDPAEFDTDALPQNEAITATEPEHTVPESKTSQYPEDMEPLEERIALFS